MERITFPGFAPSRFLVIFPSGLIAAANALAEELVTALGEEHIRVFDLEKMQEITCEGELEDITDIDDVDLEEELSEEAISEFLGEEE